MQNLFSYPLIVDELTPSVKKYSLEATNEQLPGIAEILKVPAVKTLRAEISVKSSKKEHRVKVWGTASADIEQTSVISLENFVKPYQTKFEMSFDTAPALQKDKETEIEFDAEIIDPVIDGKIDLAAVAMEQIALVLDDFPRREGEIFEFHAKFDDQETPAQNPFAILAGLKK